MNGKNQSYQAEFPFKKESGITLVKILRASDRMISENKKQKEKVTHFLLSACLFSPAAASY